MTVAILGAGPGGYTAAIRAAQLGGEVVLIERDEVGGTCLNWGCIPTKAILASAEAYSKAKQLDSFGIDFNGTLSPNMRKIIERKNKIVSTQVKGIRNLLKSWNITLIEGKGSFLSPREMEVSLKDGGKKKIAADAFIIATGSRPANIPSLPFDGNIVLSSTDALTLTVLPKSILIVGAGVIGCEFACMFNDLGADVTIVEILPRALAMEDETISKQLERELKKKKIRLITNINIDKLRVTEKHAHATFSSGEELTVDKVLVSVGRAFNTTDMGLDNTGISLGPRNDIPVNKRLQTDVPHIYAIGDVTGKALLAHVASKQGQVSAENVMGRMDEFDYDVIPAAIFTSPEIASVGLREYQARDQGIEYITGEFQFRTLGKAHAMGSITGQIKVIASRRDDRILGAHIIGPHASDLIHEFAVAKRAGLKIKDISKTIHAHPTLSEGLMEACEDVHNMAIHAPRK